MVIYARNVGYIPPSVAKWNMCLDVTGATWCVGIEGLGWHLAG